VENRHIGVLNLACSWSPQNSTKQNASFQLVLILRRVAKVETADDAYADATRKLASAEQHCPAEHLLRNEIALSPALARQDG
jgi:hypothetical protein